MQNLQNRSRFPVDYFTRTAFSLWSPHHNPDINEDFLSIVSRYIKTLNDTATYPYCHYIKLQRAAQKITIFFLQ
jgi:hypothetical protein